MFSVTITLCNFLLNAFIIILTLLLSLLIINLIEFILLFILILKKVGEIELDIILNI